MRAPPSLHAALNRLSVRQRQYAMLAALTAAGVGTLWAVFALTDDRASTVRSSTSSSASAPPVVTQVGVMAAGQQVNPLDQWVGNAGKKLAQYDADKQEQAKLNAERRAFEESVLKRLAEFEQRQTAAALPTPAGGTSAAFPPPLPTAPLPQPALPPTTRTGGMPSSLPPAVPTPAEPTALLRVAIAAPATPAPVAAATPAVPGPPGAASRDGEPRAGTVDTYLPVSFTRGILLGGLDAPTGGQAQANPHPLLIRLEDNAVLPNRFRSEVQECFVIAAGYGDISAERAYARTETLSCVRHDGSTLEVKIQGSLYGEDGKVGLRGRLVTKQGQMLANALAAGIVGGIGQGFAQSGSTVTSSTFGTIATTNGTTRDQIERGVGGGVGRALDRLAQYYIKLAEQTFPVIEIDAGRQVDVVITKGVRIEAGDPARTRPSVAPLRHSGQGDLYTRKDPDEED